MKNKTSIYSNQKFPKSIIKSIKVILKVEKYNTPKDKDSMTYNSQKKDIRFPIILNKKLKIFYYITLFYLICYNLSVECNQLDYSYIKLKTNKTGYIQIISELFNNLPDKIEINGQECSVARGYYLSDADSTIILKWYDNLDTTSNMFNGCSNITEIDLSNIEISQVTGMSNMFSGCSSLKSIDLSNIDTSTVLDMSNMFSGCSSLKSIDLSNIDTSTVLDMSNIFSGCSNLEFLNLKLTIITETLINNILLINNLANILICSENDNLANFFQKEKEINCYDTNNNKILNEILKCYSNISISVNNEHICGICGNNFFMKYDYNSNSNNDSYINCFDAQNGYYLDKNDYLYKSCYHSCKTCEIDGNELFHNCFECKDDYKYEKNFLNYKNCYKNINEKFNHRGELIKSSIENIFNELNMTEIDNGEDKKIVEKDLTVILTSTINQKNNEDKNNITMNLGECENKLKNAYNISNNESLYILQIISKEEGMKIPKTEYEIYYPFNNNLTKLDLISCKDTKIEISITVKINDSLDKYNSSSNYYNDICYKTTSESGTDISLKDRRNEFIENNMTLCQENCDLIGYNYEKAKAKCSCDIKLNISENYNIKFNKKDFYKNFIDINSIANINIIKCFKIVLKIKSLMKNYGFFIMLIIFIIYIITFFIFWFLSYKLLKKDINNIISSLNYNETIKIEQVNKNKIKKNKGKKKRKQRKKNNENNENLDLGNKNDNNNNREYIRTELENKKELIKDDYSGQITQNIENNSNKRINKIDIKAFGLVDVNNINDKNLKELLEQKDFELNSLDYKEAWKFDKRTYFKYYISLLKNNHPIMFSFAPYKDYNSKIIKIFLFFFSFGTDFTINALFFNDETMHKIYEDKGKFNFLFQIPQIIYSSLISKFIDLFIRKLALSQDNIVKLKQENEKMKIGKKSIRTIKVLKKKFISFFVIVFFILLFFWYYIICFCGIYINTQMHLIKDSAFSLLTELLYPLAMCLIPGIFRISALRVDKPNRGFLYKFSSFLENYLC